MRGSQGSRFGPYELIRRLGAGGMAETFVAVRRGPGGFEQRVCVKRILPAFEEDEGFVDQFLHEARLSARLRHANVVQVMDFGVHGESHYLALELVDGLDLRKLFKALHRAQAPLPYAISQHLAVEMAAALEHAHGHDVVHRDISPSNVLLSTAGEVKLTDFGIARAMDQQSVTQTGVIKGKVPYMAPEYANHGTLDARSDLFALGVVLFECVAGRRPYDGPTDLETIARSAMGAHTPLAELAPGAPGALVEAVERLIRPDPEARFACAADLLDALASVPPAPRARRDLGQLVQRHVSRPEPEADPPLPEAVATHALADPSSAPGSLEPLETATTQPDRPGAPAATRTEWWPGPHTDVAGPHEVTRTARSSPAPRPPARAGPRVGIPTALLVLAVAFVASAAFVWAPERGSHAPAEDAPHDERDPTGEAPRADPLAAAEGDPPPHREREAPTPSAAVAEPEGPPDGQGVQTDAGGGPRPASEAPPEEEPSTTTASADESGVRDAPGSRDHLAHEGAAILHVVVVPFGDVWIDGRHVGPSPARLRVPAGLHTVATGDGAPETSTRVRVRAGERRRVVLQ